MIATFKQRLEAHPALYMIIFVRSASRVLRLLFSVALFYFAYTEWDPVATFAGMYFGYQAAFNTGCGMKPSGGCAV